MQPRPKARGAVPDIARLRAEVKGKRSASPKASQKKCYRQEKPASSKGESEPVDRGRKVRAVKSVTITPEDDPHNRANYKPEKIIVYYSHKQRARSKNEHTPKIEEVSEDELAGPHRSSVIPGAN